MVKNFIKLIPAAALMVVVGCSSQPSFVVKGTTNAETETVYITSGKDTLVAAPVVNGAFEATLPLDETSPNTVYVRDGSRQSAMLFVENGTVNYSKTEDGIKLSGAPLNAAFQAYQDKMAELNEAYRKAESDEEVEAIYEQSDKLEKDFYEQNRDNYIGLYQLQQLQYSMEGEELEAELAKLNPSLASLEAYKKLADRAEILKKTAVGQKFIDIKLADQNGKEISLSEIVANNKYVLLDFWASWCGPCMRELPYLVPAYNKFNKKGFEIYGVSLDQTKDPWVNAIKDNKMDWVHVSDLKYWQSAGAALYGVNSIPANYLIDSEGTIIAKSLRGQAVAEKLEELLGK